MKKIIFLLVFISPLLTNAQRSWGKEVWDAYMNSCVETAKTGMSESAAKSYCACTASKLEVRYPDATQLGSVGQEEITELATICLEETDAYDSGSGSSNTTTNTNGGAKAPTPPGKTVKGEYIGPTNWSKAGYDSFMNSCVDSAKDALGGEKEARKYCDCSASKLQVMYPDETKVGNVTEEEINKVAAECLGN